MRLPRVRFTIRRLMGLMVFVAVWCAQWAYLRSWEARRPVMYQQRDVSRSIIAAAGQDIAGRPAAGFRGECDRVTYTSHWTERLEAWETRDGRRRPLFRATVSGGNGRFSLPSIVVETHGSPLDGPWLDRLLRAYRERGWKYEVVRAPGD